MEQEASTTVNQQARDREMRETEDDLRAVMHFMSNILKKMAEVLAFSLGFVVTLCAVLYALSWVMLKAGFE
ncbi:hypothetical protein [Hydrogenophaga sp. PML113]|uniref:hypothetical protein n=1 Tax=Hydrogenophaga sp. PML113 TaxID=1899350 RepID=UPI0011130A8C|nr:hypothetical protein [Hydrogenophaga sp. PML113]